MYKQGQGVFSRTGILVLIALFGIYSGYSWYNHFLDVDMSSGALAWAWGGAVVLAVGFIVLGIMTSVTNPKSCDFLIDMDVELRKVIWPDTQPVFDPKAEAWGATYVVIITVIVFALFIYLVDVFLTYTVQMGLLPWLYS